MDSKPNLPTPKEWFTSPLSFNISLWAPIQPEWKVLHNSKNVAAKPIQMPTDLRIITMEKPRRLTPLSLLMLVTVYWARNGGKELGEEEQVAAEISEKRGDENIWIKNLRNLHARNWNLNGWRVREVGKTMVWHAYLNSASWGKERVWGRGRAPALVLLVWGGREWVRVRGKVGLLVQPSGEGGVRWWAGQMGPYAREESQF